MSSLFDSNLDWRLGVIRWRGAHFVVMVPTETEFKMENESSPIHKRLRFWGHKFEDYLTNVEMPTLPSPKKFYATMNRAELGRFTLLYSCEIDGYQMENESNANIPQSSYVEIKTVHANQMLDLKTSS